MACVLHTNHTQELGLSAAAAGALQPKWDGMGSSLALPMHPALPFKVPQVWGTLHSLKSNGERNSHRNAPALLQRPSWQESLPETGRDLFPQRSGSRQQGLCLRVNWIF